MLSLTSGDGQAGEALLDRAVQQAETWDEHETSPLDRARVITERARHLITRGEPDQAGRLLWHACQLFTDAGSAKEAVVAMGWIADIAYRRGDYDEALRIHHDVELPVYERSATAKRLMSIILVCRLGRWLERHILWEPSLVRAGRPSAPLSGPRASIRGFRCCSWPPARPG